MDYCACKHCVNCKDCRERLATIFNPAIPHTVDRNVCENLKFVNATPFVYKSITVDSKEMKDVIFTGEFGSEIQPKPAPLDNPKVRDSSHKVPLHLCPESAIIAIAFVIAQGHKKPGRSIYNWREFPIKYSDYLDAVKRHLAKHADGEEFDEELSKLAGVNVSHWDAALAGMAIVVDAREAGTLIDDRGKPGGAAKFLARLTKTPA